MASAGQSEENDEADEAYDGNDKNAAFRAGCSAAEDRPLAADRAA